ncbi:MULTISPECIES: GTP cyclohydrolase II [Micrococcaceae]|uniref:GTP cyclohydrolase II n=1 Tax=unclassified Kocuria TaxID=2649579 RepID=UPI00101333C4|nr:MULTISPECIES: GTP cyclohydrolase II [unclassified Kocuria]
MNRLSIQNNDLVESTEAVIIPTPFGLFSVRGWLFPNDHELLSFTAVREDGQPVDVSNPFPLVRLHSECATGDIFGSYRCDCGPQLHEGLERISECGGTAVYLRGHEGRGIGLVNKLKAYRLQDQGLDTVDANVALGFEPDERDYEEAAVVLSKLGIGQLRLMTNNPAKVEALTSFGFHVKCMVPDEVAPRPENSAYMMTKKIRMNHKLNLNEEPAEAAHRSKE